MHTQDHNRHVYQLVTIATVDKHVIMVSFLCINI